MEEKGRLSYIINTVSIDDLETQSINSHGIDNYP